MSEVKFVSVVDFAGIIADKPECYKIDVRTGAEYAACHVKGVDLFPLQEFDAAKVVLAVESKSKGQPVYVLCKAGGRAKQAAEKLAGKTTSDIYVVEGGTDACVALGSVPVNKAAGSHMSLERQVRIAAGGLVALGVLLSVFFASGFIWLSGAVGLGLVLAGITDTCMMGMLLARMPWNKA